MAPFSFVFGGMLACSVDQYNNQPPRMKKPHNFLASNYHRKTKGENIVLSLLFDALLMGVSSKQWPSIAGILGMNCLSVEFIFGSSLVLLMSFSLVF